MSSVTFPVDLGGDGSTVTDDANATTGLANGGHRARFVPALAQVVAMAGTAVEAAEAANNAPGTNGTSTSSVALGLGAKTLTMQAGRSIVPGMQLLIANTADPANKYMHGIATAYDDVTGVLDFTSDYALGSGTLSAWTISLTGLAVIPATPIGSLMYLNQQYGVF